jgi:hypothetical protein
LALDLDLMFLRFLDVCVCLDGGGRKAKLRPRALNNPHDVLVTFLSHKHRMAEV